jgi:hypothetical protein
MNITDAINKFAGIHPKFDTADRPSILRVVDELSLSDKTFTFSDDCAYILDWNWREYTDFTAVELQMLKSAPYFDYERDHQGTIRIHPTMVLAKKCFAGSRDRGSKPNPIHRHHLPLVGWTDKSGGHPETLRRDREVFCQTEFLWVPIGTECPCGERHPKPQD